MGITIASGAGALVKGQVVAQNNTGVASGHYSVYNNAGSGGLDVAKGILTDAFDATASGVQGSIYIHGVIYEVRCTGLDTTAKSDLKDITFVSSAS
jgi:hypothetical protein